MTTRTVKVPGISCGHCVATIEREVGKLDGVESVKAENLTRQVTVSWDPAAIEWGAIVALLEEINYPPAAD
jgi:copper chaperone